MRFLFLSLLLGLIFSACVYKPQIDSQRVDNVISFLASDSLKGRKVFTPEIDRAAEFIANQFAEAGLKPFPGNDGFLQNFGLRSFSPDSLFLEINGRLLSRNDFFADTNAEKLELSYENTSVKYISDQDNFQEKVREYSLLKSPFLVVISEIHRNGFNGLKSRTTQKKQTEGTHTGVPLLFAMFSEEVESFVFQGSFHVKEFKLANVVGYIEGKRQEEIVLFSAHYDHIGEIAQKNGDNIANGANDNASGTTAVIELAHYFSTRPQPERSVLFVAFTAEESGGYGSKYFSQQLNPDEIVAMFNIEMIGKPAVSGPNSAWITGYDKSSFGELMKASAEGTGYEFYPDPYPAQNLFYRSDNATLARLGVPAHTISTTPIDVDKDYHQVTDEIATVDLEHLKNTIKALIIGSKGIISGRQTPTRVDASSLN